MTIDIGEGIQLKQLLSKQLKHLRNSHTEGKAPPCDGITTSIEKITFYIFQTKITEFNQILASPMTLQVSLFAKERAKRFKEKCKLKVKPIHKNNELGMILYRRHSMTIIRRQST